jgi:hypothetical protein
MLTLNLKFRFKELLWFLCYNKSVLNMLMFSCSISLLALISTHFFKFRNKYIYFTINIAKYTMCICCMALFVRTVTLYLISVKLFFWYDYKFIVSPVSCEVGPKPSYQNKKLPKYESELLWVDGTFVDGLTIVKPERLSVRNLPIKNPIKNYARLELSPTEQKKSLLKSINKSSIRRLVIDTLKDLGLKVLFNVLTNLGVRIIR